MTEIIPTDVFVVTPVGNGPTIFAKNSHRPKNEVQEIVYIKGENRESNKLKCTYIEIQDTDGPVNSIILSKPSWMWGAEMGSNDQNVCICNIALKSNYNDEDADASIKRLLGTDLVRISLERGKTAEDCVDVITKLLEEYGQGGSYGKDDSEIFYHNSFVIVDPKEAWILETCGKFWAAEKLDSIYKHITNDYTIHTKIDKMFDGLKEKMQELNLWDGEGEFDFAKCFSTSEPNNHDEAEKLMSEVYSENINTADVFKILRNKDCKICHSVDDQYPTQGSQVSCISKTVPSVHWFTGTPDPSISVYKPFAFTPNVRISQHVISNANDPNLYHMLYSLHLKHNNTQSDGIFEVLQKMEEKCLDELSEFLNKYAEGSGVLEELDDLMKDCVETEVKFYR